MKGIYQDMTIVTRRVGTNYHTVYQPKRLDTCEPRSVHAGEQKTKTEQEPWYR